MGEREDVVHQAGSIGGLVRSFVASKAFGFVDGDDGESYFVHQNDVKGAEPLVTGQRITFVPTPSPKGSKATQVIPGLGPTSIYENPSHFIVTNAERPLDVDVIFLVGSGWVESNDQNRAREDLIAMAKTWGGNAIVNSKMDRYTQQQSCSNYKFTMFRASGDFAVVKAIAYSSDPMVITAAQQSMDALYEWWEKQSVTSPEAEPREPGSSSHLVPPQEVKKIALIAWSWTCTIGKILYLTGLHFAKKGIVWYKGRNKKN